MLTDAQVGSHYAMAAFGDYWGAKPYFEPLRYKIHYRFLHANKRYTRGLGDE